MTYSTSIKKSLLWGWPLIIFNIINSTFLVQYAQYCQPLNRSLPIFLTWNLYEFIFLWLPSNDRVYSWPTAWATWWRPSSHSTWGWASQWASRLCCPSAESSSSSSVSSTRSTARPSLWLTTSSSPSTTMSWHCWPTYRHLQWVCNTVEPTSLFNLVSKAFPSDTENNSHKFFLAYG